MSLLNEVQALFDDIKECGRIEQFLDLRLSLALSPSDVRVMREVLARARKKNIRRIEELNKEWLQKNLGDDFGDLTSV
jgi:hypothetical protein